MKHSIKKIVLIAFFFVPALVYSQGQWKAQDEWVTNIATVDFENGEIYYTINYNSTASNLHPELIHVGWYKLRSGFPLVFMPKDKNLFLNLDFFVESFEIEKSDSYDKIKFIKAATLEMIWATYYVNLFSDISYSNLQELTKDKDISVSSRAKQAVSLYQKIVRASNIHKQKRSFSEINGFMNVSVQDSDASIKFSYLREDITVRIILTDGQDNILLDSPLNKTLLEKGYILQNLKAGTYFIRLSFNGREMEKKKFSVIK